MSAIFRRSLRGRQGEIANGRFVELKFAEGGLAERPLWRNPTGRIGSRPDFQSRSECVSETSAVMYLPRRVHPFRADFWQARPERRGIGAMSVLVVYVAWKMIFTGWVFPLDNFTLAIHEAGHPIVGLLMGDRMTVYGGSLFQVLFPAVTAWHFAHTKQPLGFVFAVAWEAASLHNLGIYVADARDQVLPLVGNGDRLHDWAEILGRWHLIGACQFLGGGLKLAGVCLASLCLWLLIRLWRRPAASGR